MATANNNLSDYDKNKVPDASSMRFGIVVSEWNDNITGSLLQGAVDTLSTHGVTENNMSIHWIAGTFELPLSAQLMLEADSTLDGVICIGSVIQGETKHFDYVCEAATQGIKDVSLKYNKPVIFCVLTDNNMQQSIDRSGGKHGNKGVECAVAGIKMVAFKNAL